MGTQVEQTVAALRTYVRDLERGERLPTEPSLAQQFQVSRATLRDAIARLQIDGVVEKRWGVGTFVLEPTPSLGFGLLSFRPGIVASLAAVGGVVGLPHAKGEWAAPDPHQFADYPNADVVALERVYTVDETPAMLVRDRFVGEHAGRRIDLDQDWMTALIPDLLDGIGVDFIHLEMQLSAHLPSERECQLLAIEPNCPVLLAAGTGTNRQGSTILGVNSVFNTSVVQPVASSTIEPPRRD